MSDMIIQIIAGVIGTVGFAVLFRLKPSHWILAAIDGFLACVCYVVCADILETVFLPNVLAAFVCAYGAEVFARIAKAPSTVFLLPGIIVFVPGRPLYYSMSNLLNENYSEAGRFLLTTIEIAAAIGGGIIAASLLKIVTFKVYDKIKLKISSKS